MKAIAKDPAERYRSMDELIHALVSLGIGGELEVYFLPQGLTDGDVIRTSEQSIMAWAHAPAGVRHVRFEYSVDGSTWTPIGDPVPSRPGRENMFGVDWDPSHLPEGTRVLVRAVAVDRNGRQAVSEPLRATIGRIEKSA